MLSNPYQPMMINTLSDYSGFVTYPSTSSSVPGVMPSTFRLYNDRFLSRRSSQALTAEEKRENRNKNERNRMKGLNGHIDTFRSLFPYLIKKDKASVLGELVRQLKVLNKRVVDMRSAVGKMAEASHGGGVSGVAAGILLPDDTNNANVRRADQADASLLIATLSCEDRGNLIPDIITAPGSANGRVIRAEMATVGGRVKTKLWVRVAGVATCCGSSGGKDEATFALQRALRDVVEKERTWQGVLFRSE
ncbi:hypothetical protein Drorol1_Dr00021915 [Drosera rotundifolia]